MLTIYGQNRSESCSRRYYKHFVLSLGKVINYYPFGHMTCITYNTSSYLDRAISAIISNRSFYYSEVKKSKVIKLIMPYHFKFMAEKSSASIDKIN
jgi:hypothetical protein